jgi:lysozyme
MAARAEPPDQEAETTPPPAPKQKEQIKPKKSEPNDLARKYKIYYRTKDGEDLAQISRKFNVSEDQLRLWNALKSSDSLVPGQVLVINKSTKTDKPVVVAKAPSPPEAKRVEKKKEPVVKEPAPQKLVTTPPPRPEAKQDDAAAEETPVDSPDATGGTGDSLAAGGGEPTPEVPETPSTEPVGETVHVVQEGESLSAIGQKHGVSWLALATWNNIEPPGTIYVGQRLRIPEISEPTETSPSTTEVTHGEAANSEVTHRVKRGENLYRIGRLYDLTWKQVAQANGITDPSQIYEGQVLKIPAAQGAQEE